MTTNKEKKRLALTANKMPDDVYEKLEKLGSTRRLTPYIVSLMEKEEVTDKLISGLSALPELIAKIDRLEKTVSELNHKLEHSEMKAIPDDPVAEQESEIIQQGDLGTLNEVKSAIDEDMSEDMDF